MIGGSCSRGVVLAGALEVAGTPAPVEKMAPGHPLSGGSHPALIGTPAVVWVLSAPPGILYDMTVSGRMVSVRLSAGDVVVLEGAAVAAGVSLGALVREAALRGASSVVRDVGDGSLRLRRANGSGGVAFGDPGSMVPGRVVPARDPEGLRPVVLSVGQRRAEAFRRAAERR